MAALDAALPWVISAQRSVAHVLRRRLSARSAQAELVGIWYECDCPESVRGLRHRRAGDCKRAAELARSIERVREEDERQIAASPRWLNPLRVAERLAADCEECQDQCRDRRGGADRRMSDPGAL
jgi:hypothetical protein